MSTEGGGFDPKRARELLERQRVGERRGAAKDVRAERADLHHPVPVLQQALHAEDAVDAAEQAPGRVRERLLRPRGHSRLVIPIRLGMSNT